MVFFWRQRERVRGDVEVYAHADSNSGNELILKVILWRNTTVSGSLSDIYNELGKVF